MHTYLRARLLGLKVLEVEGTVVLEPAEPRTPPRPGLVLGDPPRLRGPGDTPGTQLALTAQRLEKNIRSLRTLSDGRRL